MKKKKPWIGLAQSLSCYSSCDSDFPLFLSQNHVLSANSKGYHQISFMAEKVLSAQIDPQAKPQNKLSPGTREGSGTKGRPR